MNWIADKFLTPGQSLRDDGKGQFRDLWLGRESFEAARGQLFWGLTTDRYDIVVQRNSFGAWHFYVWDADKKKYSCLGTSETTIPEGYSSSGNARRGAERWAKAYRYGFTRPEDRE